MNIMDNLSESLQQGRVDEVTDLTRQAINDGIDPKTILDRGLIAGMAVVGERSRPTRSSCPTFCWPPKPCTPAWTC